MKKSDLISNLMKRVEGLTESQASKVVNEVFNIISDALSSGDSYSHDKFGTFKVVHRAARKGRNPKTGEQMLIPETAVPKWIVSKQLKEKVSK
jgi:DNA-binding protein HU-beta